MELGLVYMPCNMKMVSKPYEFTPMVNFVAVDEQPPTQRKAYDLLFNEEKEKNSQEESSDSAKNSAAAGSDKYTRLQFIRDGLLIEAEQ